MSFDTRKTRSVILMVLLALGPAFAGLRVKGESVDFLRDVRPILAGHCFKCHGPDENARKAEMRLDLREEAVKKAIVPHKPDESELVRRVFTSDPDDLMPPPSAKLPLDAAQKETLRRWIADGAEYKPHWAFVRPKEPVIPAVSNAAWPKNPIDFFILARLEKDGLSPSPRADQYTLVRRLYLDLIGLPPTPAQVDAFVRDNSPGAYERLVDSLLASPHYGERWARRWLDLARYADTNGYEKDRPRSIWPYRDWVIRALNADLPFDEFTVEQIAGDMLPHPTTDQLVATGFHRNTMFNEEGGIDPLEFRFYSMVDRVHVTATTWLGLTMACAQCHTHKYDPIQHREYYQFMAFLNNADEPKMDLPDARIAAQREKGEEKIAQMEAKLGEHFPPDQTIEWITPTRQDFSSEEGADYEALVDGSFRVTGKNPDKDTYTVRFAPGPRTITHVQIEALPDEKVEKGGPGRADDGSFVLSEIQGEVSSGTEARPLEFSAAEADLAKDEFSAEKAIDGKEDTGWSPGSDKSARAHHRIILTLKEPIVLQNPGTIELRLRQAKGGRSTLGRFRVSVGRDVSPEDTLAERRRAHLERRYAQWLRSEMSNVVEWIPLRPAQATSAVPSLDIQSDASVFASGDFTKSDRYHLVFHGVPDGVKALRIEALPDPRLPGGGPGRTYLEGPDGEFWLSTVKVHAGENEVGLTNATESFADGSNDAGRAIDDDLQSGWSNKGRIATRQHAVFQFTEPIHSPDVEVDLFFERYYPAAMGRFRIAMTTAANARASILSEESYELALREKGSMASSDGEPDQAFMGDFAQVAPELKGARAEIDKARANLPKFTTTLVMHERPEAHDRPTFLHHRGEFLQPREKVEPGVPAFLAGSGPQPHNRLEFARWLVSPENPLTARVIMNRHWEAFFGRGIVRTLEDFGFQGELPSHPKLLDWLALEFIQRGWSQKEMHKLIVMSATYQQSSAVSPELLEKDPLNVLLARGPRFRLDAELVRDSALVGSGLLTEKLGGPSVFPPQPAGVTTEGTYGPLQWKTSEGADRYRRALYTFAKRTAPFAMNLTFDGPSGEACLARRDRSNTPLQALTLLNDQVFIECSRAVGNLAAARPTSPESTAAWIFRCFMARPPSASECGKLARFYDTQLQRLDSGDLKAAKIMGVDEKAANNKEAAWALVARVILNLDETITKP